MSRTHQELATELVTEYWRDWEDRQKEDIHEAVEPNHRNGIDYYQAHVASPKECADGVIETISEPESGLLRLLDFYLRSDRFLDDETISAFGWTSAILNRALAQDEFKIYGRIVSAGMKLHPDATHTLLLAVNQMYPKE